MRLRFGLQFIPEGKLFRTGSSLIGYDIRAPRTVALADFVEPSWQTASEPFGFHASVTDAITIDEADLPHALERTRVTMLA